MTDTATIAQAPARTRARLRLPTLRWPSTMGMVNLIVVGATVLFVFRQLHPELLFRNTLAAGGDMGAHVWLPAYMRDHLLPHGRLTGWTPDWYAGFPVLVFYFPLPSLMIVLLDLLLPYAIAFKLVTVLGVLTLPIAAFVFARLLGLRDPGPACLAVATLPFLFDRTFTIYGGNIPSTLAGEFAFSISLSLMLVFLGVFARGLETGRWRALAAVLLALTGLCHMIPAMFAVGGAAILLLMRLDRYRLRWAVPVLATGGALAGFWAIPFLLRLPYTNDMGWEKIQDYKHTLFPTNYIFIITVAAVAVVVAVAQRNRTGIFLGAAGVGTAFMFVFAPQGRLWNARLLPFWFLWIWLLIGLAAFQLGMFAVNAIRTRDRAAGTNGSTAEPGPSGGLAARLRGEPFARAIELGIPVVALLGALVFVGYPLRILPGGHVDASGKYTWLGITSADRSFVPDWVKWNYTGYEDKGKPRRAEYDALVALMSKIGQEQGCGRAMWEYESEEDGFGTPMALMLLPHFTNGCIGSMEGLFFESSATTPYHFLDQAELSERPSEAMRNLPYRGLSVLNGAAHLQLLGVKYYMALTPAAQAQADTDPDLRLLASSGPWTVQYSNGPQQRTWKVYEVADTDLVTPLQYKPVVMTNVAKGGKDYLAASVSWYQNANRWDVPLASSGPKDWARAKVPKDPLGNTAAGGVTGQIGVDETPRVPITDPPTVTNIKTSDNRISFDVSEVGKPVLVKMSYFPNWQVSGAKEVYRVSPNQMVVVPTKTHVSLHYGTTPVDWFGYLVTLLGLVGVVYLWRKGPIQFPERKRSQTAGTDESGSEPGGDDLYSAALARQLAGVSSGQNVDVDDYFDTY